MPFFSIIIPTYNRAEMAREAVEAALAQNYKDFEIIVVDDGSSDNTTQLLKTFEDQIILVKKQNAGVAAARNTGIAIASGSFICYLDSDDLWPENKLELFKQAIDRNPEASLVFSDFHKHNVKLPKPYDLSNSDMFPFIYELGTNTTEATWSLEGESLLTLVFRGYPFYPSTIAIKKDVHEQYRWDPGILKSEDFNLILKLAGQYKFTYIDRSLATVRVHDSNKSSDFITKNHINLTSMKLYRDLYTPRELHPFLNAFISQKQLSNSRAYTRERFYSDGLVNFLIAMSYRDNWKRLSRKVISKLKGSDRAK